MGTISAQIDAKRNLINRSIHRTSILMCKQHIGTNHPLGTTGENYHTISRCKHLGFEGEIVTAVHGRNGVEGKVPGEEEQQIRPRTGAGGSRSGRDGSGKAGGGTRMRGATGVEERDGCLVHPVPLEYMCENRFIG